MYRMYGYKLKQFIFAVQWASCLLTLLQLYTHTRLASLCYVQCRYTGKSLDMEKNVIVAASEARYSQAMKFLEKKIRSCSCCPKKSAWLNDLVSTYIYAGKSLTSAEYRCNAFVVDKFSHLNVEGKFRVRREWFIIIFIKLNSEIFIYDRKNKKSSSLEVFWSSMGHPWHVMQYVYPVGGLWNHHKKILIGAKGSTGFS